LLKLALVVFPPLAPVLALEYLGFNILTSIFDEGSPIGDKEK
jgi:hypothetical protein